MTANGGGVSVESPLPEPVAEHRDPRLPLGGGFAFGERSPDGRADADHFEEVGGHRQAVHALHLIAAAQVQRHPPKAGDRLEDAALLQIAIVQVRELIAVSRLDADHTVGRHDRRRVKEDGAKSAEERQVDAQPEAEREHADDHETWTGAEHSSGARDVLEKRVEHHPVSDATLRPQVRSLRGLVPAPVRLGACAGPDSCVTIRLLNLASTTTEADLSLLHRIAARDEAALADLYDRHSQMAFSVIMRILRSSADAEDVLQETFVRVWSRAETYDARLGSPVAWLTRIARNRALDRLRARRVRKDISVEPGAAGLDAESARLREPATSETPEVVLQWHAAAGMLRAAMAALPVAQRELIEAAFFEGYTHQELAVRFGVPLGTVKTRIRAGLSALRGRLEPVA